MRKYGNYSRSYRCEQHANITHLWNWMKMRFQKSFYMIENISSEIFSLETNFWLWTSCFPVQCERFFQWTIWLFFKISCNQRVKKREEKTQIFGFWAGQSGQIFLAGHIWAVKCSHRWQHLWAKVKIKNLL